MGDRYGQIMSADVQVIQSMLYISVTKCYKYVNNDSSPLFSMLGPKALDSEARCKNVQKIGLQINDGRDGPKSTWTGLFFGAAPNNLILSERRMVKWLEFVQPSDIFQKQTHI